MSEQEKSGGAERRKPVQNSRLKSSDKERSGSKSAKVRSTAAKKAARTRVRRAKILKTLKTGEESFSVGE